SGASVWACSNMVSGFIVGRSDDDGATFTPMLKLSTIRGPLSCGPGTTSQSCVELWPALRETLAGPEDAGTPTPPPPTKDGGCSSTGMPAGAGVAIAALVAGAIAIARRRRRDA